MTDKNLEVNIIEKSVKNSERFPAVGGTISTEDLYKLALSSTDERHTTLNTVAVALSNKLAALGSVDFVDDNTTEKDELAFKLNVVKHVIADRKAEVKKAEEAKAIADELRDLTQAIAEKRIAEGVDKPLSDLEDRQTELLAKQAAL